MINGEKIRFDVHNILYSVYKFNKKLNDSSIMKVVNKNKKKDISFLNNVILNSMRFHLHVEKIITQYIKKKLRDHEKILLLSAITQIVFLDFKEYAVINCSVEIAKKLKIYPGLINACLKKISIDKDKLKNTKISFDNLPIWFKEKTHSFSSNEKSKFIETFIKEPDLHIVFKSKKNLINFDEKLIKTSEISGFVLNKKKIEDIESYSDGTWWVQDFSSFFPLHNLEIKDTNKKFLDSCAAPGGKSFQILSRNMRIVLNDISKKRIIRLKENLVRLNFNTKVLNKDFTNFEIKEKFDFIIIDSPCSSIGTIRKNPEIFFQKKGPDFERLNILQEKMLEKASNIINNNGIIIYMVCSFLENESTDQIKKFLRNKKEFKLHNFKVLNENSEYTKLVKNNFMMTLPNSVLGYNIDGYFAAFIKKVK